MPDYRRRLEALERHTQQNDRMTEAEISAGVARYRCALGEGSSIAGIPSPDQFAAMLRGLPAWMARTFAFSADPADLLL